MRILGSFPSLPPTRNQSEAAFLCPQSAAVSLYNVLKLELKNTCTSKEKDINILKSCVYINHSKNKGKNIPQTSKCSQIEE